jgi:hypothetical protein
MPAPAYTLARRKAAGKKARDLGDRCEHLAMDRLAREGVLAQRIATPCVVVGGRKRYTHRVVGDLVGVTAAGRAVIVECKAHADGSRPARSDFLPHQRATLAKWHAAGAQVLVAWIAKSGHLSLRPVTEILTDIPPRTP